MDISQIGIGISLLSVSFAVLKQNWNGKKSNNGCYVKRDDCHTAMSSINQRIDDHNTALNNRITDLDGKMDMAISLIKNGNGKK